LVVQLDGVGEDVVRDGVGEAVAVRDGVGDAVAERLGEAEAVGVADRLVDGDALVGVVPPLHATPFTVNAVGLE